jgi:four helix bundle protein
MLDQIHSYKDLIVWQKSMLLVTEVYVVTSRYPKQEIYGLVSQSRRCVVSIPSNIAEGRRRGSKKDFRQFLIIAFSSGAELETQLLIARNLNYINVKDCEKADALLEEVMKMLNAMINNMKD